MSFKVDRNETTFITLTGEGYDKRKIDSSTSISKDEIPNKEIGTLPNQVYFIFYQLSFFKL